MNSGFVKAPRKGITDPIVINSAIDAKIVSTKMVDSHPRDLLPDNIHNVDLLTSGINKINEAMQTIIYTPIIINWTQQINTYLTPPHNSFTLPNFSFWTNKKVKDSWDEHPKIGHYPIRAQVSHLHVIKHETGYV